MSDNNFMDAYLSQHLNPSQLDAVTYCDGPSLVIAGAGSGKTRVLTYKIAYLVQNGLPPWNILALTFTNKAAREMNERIAQIVGKELTRNLWSGTFHSIFARILRRESDFIGFSSDFTIYDSADSRNLVKTIVKEMGLDEKKYKPATVAGRISEAKNNLLLPDQYAAQPTILQRDNIDGLGKVHEIYSKYWQRCRQANAMDFDDLLLNTYLLLLEHPEIRSKYMDRFQYILVDEYQDTNTAQYRIISLLTQPDSRICVVGDDAQSIYGFRGAKIDNILQFTQQYPSARLIKLEENYRSTQTIVNAANSIIRHNTRQITKKVFSNKEIGTPIRIISSYSDKEESLKVAGEIKRIHRAEDVDYNDIALLYRTNSQSRAFEETFRNANIPYRIYGGLSFYQRKEIKDVLAYFRLITNPNDEEAFRRILNYPARGIGATTQSKILLAAAEMEVSPWLVITHPEEYGLDFNKRTYNLLQNFVSLIEGFQQKLMKINGYTLAAEIIRESGIGADIHSDNSPENLSRQENVQELLNSMKAFEEDMLEETGREVVPLTDYLSQVSLLSDTDQEEDNLPKVTLMTVHAAKGLEFDTIFVTGMEDELFPNANARYFPREMEEERRLFYVAVTRAKRHCYLTYAKSRFKYGSTEVTTPSPFLDEIDKDYVEWEDNNTWLKPRTAHSSTLSPRAQQEPKFPPPHFTPYKKTTSALHRSSGHTVPQLRPGDIIEHERFGVGTVLQLEGTGDSSKASVKFENAGTKNLLLKFAKFKVMDKE